MSQQVNSDDRSKSYTIKGGLVLSTSDSRWEVRDKEVREYLWLDEN